jgi:hypothetical protein
MGDDEGSGVAQSPGVEDRWREAGLVHGMSWYDAERDVVPPRTLEWLAVVKRRNGRRTISRLSGTFTCLRVDRNDARYM